MQHGRVDLVIVGSDRTTRNGDACNKIGTYLKAGGRRRQWRAVLRRSALPTIDWQLADGRQIPIEERNADEVLRIRGWITAANCAKCCW